MIKEMTKAEFQKKFAEISTYGLGPYDIYLENGIILNDTMWNGETYTVRNDNGTQSTYKPVQEPISYDDSGEPEDWETLGYIEI